MSAQAIELEAAVAALYRLPLAEFVAARDQLARQLRAAGDRQAARQVAGLRRPSISAWAANQLAHAAPHAMAELLDAGAALQQAQQAALAGQPDAARSLRATHAHLRAAITRLTHRAETLLVRAGHAASDATLQRLAATLQAAATGDQATRTALTAGRLAGDLDPAGFGLPTSTPEAAADAQPEVAQPRPAPASDRVVAERARARQAAARALDATRRVAEQASAALSQAQAMADRQQQAAQVTRQHAQQLADRAQELQERAARAAAAAAEAQQQADAAGQDAAVAAERVAAAEETVSAADQAHAAAQAALEELEEP